MSVDRPEDQPMYDEPVHAVTGVQDGPPEEAGYRKDGHRTDDNRRGGGHADVDGHQQVTWPEAHVWPSGTGGEIDPSLDQPFGADDLFSLRSAVAAHTTQLGAEAVLDEAVLLAHELSSNAVRHGGGSGRLRLWRTGPALYVQVSDAGPGLPDPAQAGFDRPSPSVPGGRGLWIVRHLAAAVDIAQEPDGTTVTVAIPLPRGTR